MGEKCKVTSFSDLGITSRRSVESVFATTIPEKPNSTMVLIADGFGNHINSNLIVKLVCENFISEYTSLELKEPSKESLSDLMKDLHEYVIQKANFFSSPGLKAAFMVVLHWENKLFIANSGNIAAYYLPKGQTGELTRLTKTFTDLPVDEIPSLGMDGIFEYEVIEKSILGGDKIFIVSDGVSSVLSETDILSSIQKNPNSSFPKSIIHQAIEKETEDNCSAIILEFGSVSIPALSTEPKKTKPVPERKAKPLPPKKIRKEHTPLISHSKIPWIALLLIIILIIWWSFPRIQSWFSSYREKEASTPITTLPPVELPIEPEKPVIPSTNVSFLISPSNAFARVYSGKKEKIESLEQSLFETQGGKSTYILPPGEYTVFTQSDGYETNFTYITLNGELDYTVSIELVKIQIPPEVKPIPPKPVTQPPKPVTPVKPPIKPLQPPVIKEWAITVSSQPIGAKIYINNQFIGQFTPAILKFKPGSYLVTVSKAGYKDQSRTVVFTETQPSSPTIHFTLEKLSAFHQNHILCYSDISGEAI